VFWSKKGLNELADRPTVEGFKEITRRINGGFNGLTERQAFYTVARRVLGVADAPVFRGRTRDVETTAPADEPSFERGFEAIRAAVRRRPASAARRAKKAAPKRKGAAPKGKTAAPKRKAAAPKRKATATLRKKKTAAKSGARKTSRGGVKKR
jgi:hypothetical protein